MISKELERTGPVPGWLQVDSQRQRTTVMAKTKSRPPEPEILIAAIESIRQTYYMS